MGGKLGLPRACQNIYIRNRAFTFMRRQMAKVLSTAEYVFHDDTERRKCTTFATVYLALFSVKTACDHYCFSGRFVITSHGSTVDQIR
ncbi:hypothetical protein CHISP_2440 [Chitinispirillum alkaliphilum]|nr:hypothetical protein CHISP_2440 [Chitinispirillum alkaliphilum]